MPTINIIWTFPSVRRMISFDKQGGKIVRKKEEEKTKQKHSAHFHPRRMLQEGCDKQPENGGKKLVFWIAASSQPQRKDDMPVGSMAVVTVLGTHRVLSDSVSVKPPPPPPPRLFLSVCLSVSVSLSLCLCLSVSVSVHLCLSVSVSVSDSLCVSLCLCLSACLSVCLSPCAQQLCPVQLLNVCVC